MKIEELPHISIKRKVLDYKQLCNVWLSIERKQLHIKNGYIPIIDCMSDSYSIISRILDKDCVVAYITDKSQTTFLVKTRCQYVGFICMSEELSKYLSSHTTRRITRMYDWYAKNTGFINFTDDNEDLIIVDKNKWDNYLKIKLLEKLGNG